MSIVLEKVESNRAQSLEPSEAWRGKWKMIGEK